MSDPVHQHYVPKCYLREFVDPHTPPNYEPYVWIFERDSKKPKKKSPENIFKVTDLYTLHIPGKGKDYTVEKTLSGIESEYASIFRTKIKNRLLLTEYEHAILCAFTAAMLQRTLRYKENMARFTQQILDMTIEAEKANGLVPKQSEKIRAEMSNTQNFNLMRLIPNIGEILYRMNLMFICSDGQEKFITSDDPCNLFNPKLQWLGAYNSPGLGQKDVEVTMALSPDILLCLSWKTVSGYITVGKSYVSDLNRMTRSQCYKYFISSSPAAKIIWFSRYPLDLLFMLKVLKHRISQLPYHARRAYFNLKYKNVRKRKF